MSEGSVAHPAAERLADFGLGKLGDVEAREVWRHVEGCEECRQRVEGQTPDSFLRALKAVSVVEGADALTVDRVPSPSQHEATRTHETTALGVPLELARSAKYRILEKLGQGGMGAVYKAEQISMSRVVAIKVMSPEIIDNPEAVRRFRQEVKAAGRLHHPTIVTAFDADQVEELNFLVMEYVEGCSLDQLVKRDGPLPIEEACRLICQAAEGLQHAHEKGMVHRDIKPQNLMVSEQGAVKILDFGLAQLPLESRSRLGGTAVNSFMGTPEFVAPEQANDASSVDIRTDVYSLGCTLYYLLAGRPPFQRDTPLNTIWAHVHDEPAPLRQMREDIPDELLVVVSRMMAKKREDRYETPDEVVQALRSILALGRNAAHGGAVVEQATLVAQQSLHASLSGHLNYGKSRKSRLMYGGGILAASFLISFVYWGATRNSGTSSTKEPIRLEKEQEQQFEPPPIIKPPADIQVVGNYLRPKNTRPSVLLQRYSEEQPWTALRDGESVSTGHTLVSLPGYESVVSLKSGVRLNLWGSLPQLGDPPVGESVVQLRPAETGTDADLILDRGRVEFGNQKDKGAAVVRLSFLREQWDITLKGPKSRVVVELIYRLAAGVPVDVRVLGLFTQGDVVVKTRKKEYTFAQPARLAWRSDRPDEMFEEKLKEAPSWWVNRPEMTKEVKETLLFLGDWADKRFLVQKAEPEVVFTMLASARDPTKDAKDRELGLWFLAGIDEPGSLVEFLRDQDQADAAIRTTAMFCLQDWLRRNGQLRSVFARKLNQRFRYPMSVASQLVRLLSPIPEEDRAKAGTYQELIDLLDHDDLGLRHVAFWHLYQGLIERRPEAATKILYDPVAGKEERQAAAEKWRKLIPAGSVPPVRERK